MKVAAQKIFKAGSWKEEWKERRKEEMGRKGKEGRKEKEARKTKTETQRQRR